MVVFIILHYKTINETLECIDSINKLNLNEYKIVVVDNGSKDKSTDALKNLKRDIHVIFNEDNYGFAKGNNIGINYAKKMFNAEFYIVINNDILISQSDILEQIYLLHERYSFDVMGPKIISKDNINQNPNFNVLCKTKDIIKQLIKLNILRVLVSINLYQLLKSFKAKSNRQKSLEKIDDRVLENKPLHGSALIFSQKYVNKYEQAFDESTFLYGEEEFLYYRCINDELKFIYTPSIKVYHKEDASLNKLFENSKKEKIRFVIKNSAKSLTKLLIKKFKDKIK